MQRDINPVMSRYWTLNQKRKQLTKVASEIKAEEDSVKSYIISYLDSIGQRGIKSDDNGSATAVTKEIFTIDDNDKFMEFVLRKLIEAFKNGEPLTNGLYLQKTVHQGNVNEYVNSIVQPDKVEGTAEEVEREINRRTQEVLSSMGLRKYSERDISFKR